MAIRIIKMIASMRLASKKPAPSRHFGRVWIWVPAMSLLSADPRRLPPLHSAAKFPVQQDAYYLRTMEDGTFKKRIVWDMYPSYYIEHPAYSDNEEWRSTLVAHNSDIVAVYDRVIASFDELLAEKGYVREGRHYRVEKESKETLTFFCHFGITSVLLSHLWNVSPFVPLQSLCMPTSSVTELYTEERQKGYAHFRATRIGDTTHLTMAGLKPERLPHSALFAEVYSDFSQRHD